MAGHPCSFRLLPLAGAMAAYSVAACGRTELNPPVDSGNPAGTCRLAVSPVALSGIRDACGAFMAWDGQAFGLLVVPSESTALGLVIKRITPEGRVLVGSPKSIPVGFCSALLWLGNRYAAIGSDEQGSLAIRFIDRKGQTELGSTIIAEKTNTRVRGAAWTGSSIGVAWEDQGTIEPGVWFRALAADGTPLADKQPVALNEGNPVKPTRYYDGGALAWSGRNFWIAYRIRGDDGTPSLSGTVVVSALDPDGSSIGPGRQLGGSFGTRVFADRPAIAWTSTDNRLLVAYRGEFLLPHLNQLVLETITADGDMKATAIGPAPALTSVSPSLGFSGERYAVAWTYSLMPPAAGLATRFSELGLLPPTERLGLDIAGRTSAMIGGSGGFGIVFAGDPTLMFAYISCSR